MNSSSQKAARTVYINRFRHLPAAHEITKSAAAFFKAKV